VSDIRVATHRDNPEGAQRVIFAHGAGAGLQSDFMQFVALGLAMQNIEVVRFNFPYWQKFMDTGVRRPPDRMPHLQHAMTAVAQQFDDQKPLFLMGKSMGSRVAFQSVQACNARAAIALGFPFFPPQRRKSVTQSAPSRLVELADAVTKQNIQGLIVQGTRDSFGQPKTLMPETLPTSLQLRWINGADHGFVPLKRSGMTAQQLWQQVVDEVVAYLHEKLQE